jgi:hypothetical protein
MPAEPALSARHTWPGASWSDPPKPIASQEDRRPCGQSPIAYRRRPCERRNMLATSLPLLPVAIRGAFYHDKPNIRCCRWAADAGEPSTLRVAGGILAKSRPRLAPSPADGRPRWSKAPEIAGFCGGRTRALTWDPLIKSQLLYQLSYAPGSLAVARGRASLAKGCGPVQRTPPASPRRSRRVVNDGAGGAGPTLKAARGSPRRRGACRGDRACRRRRRSGAGRSGTHPRRACRPGRRDGLVPCRDGGRVGP